MDIPEFVIAGQPNEGKTTVVATLTENSAAETSPIPGTTRDVKKYLVEIDGITRLVIHDTPGFENPGELLEWFRENARQHDNPAQAFLSIPDHLQKYPFDCEILKGIASGAAVIHVVNPAREPLEEVFWEAEIFHHCINPRIGLLNRRREENGTHPEWERLMNRYMNTWREFDACQAVFADRIEILEALTIAVPAWAYQMREVIQALKDNWETRLSAVVTDILVDLRKTLQFQVVEEYGKGIGEQQVAKARAERKVRDKVTRIENDFRRKARKTFRHRTNHWILDESLDLDLFDQRVWEVFGFKKSTIVTACAVASAGIGLLIDIATGGGTIGLGALIGGLSGGVAAYLSIDKVVDIQLPGFHLGPFRIPRKKIGGVSLKAGIERRSRLPGILLDRMTCYAVAAARWSHGLRLDNPGSSMPDEAWKITQVLETSGGAPRLQALIELWHRSREQRLRSNEETAARDAETWLKTELLKHMRKATSEKPAST